jgi:hypothetical protein
VLWELGTLPDIRVLPLHAARPIVPAPTREAAIAARIAGFGGDQWALWPLEPDLKRRLRTILEARFDELFAADPDGFIPRFITPGREILITWQPMAESPARWRRTAAGDIVPEMPRGSLPFPWSGRQSRNRSLLGRKISLFGAKISLFAKLGKLQSNCSIRLDGGVRFDGPPRQFSEFLVFLTTGNFGAAGVGPHSGRRGFGKLMSSQPSGVTVARSPERSKTVVTADSTIAGPAIVCFGASASKS